MAKITYETAFNDHGYLWDVYGPAHDMTGGYVDQQDLDRLLRSPSKATARDCLESQIVYWFQVGPDRTHGYAAYNLKELIESDEHLREIAIRYGAYDDFDFGDEE